jgi:putative ABC transport system substrate-binding protein
MHRRQIIVSGIVAALLARGLCATPRSDARVGYLELVSAPDGELLYRDIVDGLKRHGYVEGRNLRLLRRSGDGETEMRLSTLAAELAAERVDVILAATTVAARSAAKGAPKIPTVFLASGDPRLEGLVTSLSRPEGNLTGIVTQIDDLTPKRLQLLKQAFPAIRTVAIVGSTLSMSRSAFADAANKLQLATLQFPVHRRDEHGEVAAAIRRSAASAILVVDDADAMPAVQAFTRLMMATRLPVMFNSDVFVEHFGLMAYGASLRPQYRRAAGIVARLLEGAKPSAIPVEMPTRYELVFNRRAMEEYAVALPREFLAQATEINDRRLD